MNNLAGGPRPSTSRYADAGAMKLLLAATAAGVLLMVLYGAQAQSLAGFLSIVVTGIVTGGAAFALGGLAGFLFGIPRSPREQSVASIDQGGDGQRFSSGQGAYRPSTNLEDIADWLTKILLGAGLTQLTAIRDGLQSLGAAIAPALGGFPSSGIVATGGLIYFSVAGFLTSFLWARLNLGRLLTQADIEAERETARRQGRTEGEASAVVKLTQEPEALSMRREATGKRGLWVDDMPENNVQERDMLRRVLGVDIMASTSTEDAIARLTDGYDFVITDMARPGDPRAGYTLLERVRRDNPDLPVIMYTSSERPEHNAEAIKRGALGNTSSPVRLLELVRDATMRRRGDEG